MPGKKRTDGGGKVGGEHRTLGYIMGMPDRQEKNTKLYINQGEKCSMHEYYG